ncbi:MAG: folate-binding protein YgfZ [Gammaproteobacteria bacterium]|nr:folate-binding protein YgfZ [Gammaproteobacteria bacterium]
MNNWQALVTDNTPSQPVFPACALTDLAHLGLIRVSGDDKTTFLQGQLTSDIRTVSAQQAQVSSYCSPKGRMLGSFLVFQRDDDLYLQLPAERLDPLLKRLRMFVLRSKVTIEDASGSLARFGVSGDCAAALLPFAPGTDNTSQTRDGITVIRLPGDRPRFEVVGPEQALAALWTQASGQAQQSDRGFWALMDIRAGMPTVFETTAEAFVPQMANLQLVGGVSFTKGCYTGQEVVARMQYLGKLKRRMYRAHVETDEIPAPGTEIFSPSSESGQGAGRIVDAAASPDGGFEVLAVLQISSAEAADVRLVDANGPALKLLDLPYVFEAESA